MTRSAQASTTPRGVAAPVRVAALALAALGSDTVFDPQRQHVPLCPLHALTGLDCPFCGGLRCVAAAARGHLGAALHANAVLLLAAPLIIGLWLDWLARARVGVPRRQRGRGQVIAVVGVLVVFSVLRNLPSFGWLRPAA